MPKVYITKKSLSYLNNGIAFRLMKLKKEYELVVLDDRSQISQAITQDVYLSSIWCGDIDGYRLRVLIRTEYNVFDQLGFPHNHILMNKICAMDDGIDWEKVNIQMGLYSEGCFSGNF